MLGERRAFQWRNNKRINVGGTLKVVKIAVMGSAGMGGYLGGWLAQAGRDVTFIARGQHLQAIRYNRLQVRSPAGYFVIKPAKATDDPEAVKTGRPDSLMRQVV